MAMDNTALDAKSQARFEALIRWAAEAAESGMAVPEQSHLERIAVAKTAAGSGIDSVTVQCWAATMDWLMGQASFGVADPYLQLPEDLRMPVGMDPKVNPPVNVDVTLVAIGTEMTEVVVTETLVPEAKKAPKAEKVSDPANSTPSRLPKWESAALEQVREAIVRCTKPLQELRARDANEGDTRLVVTDLLCEGLGYDKFRDLTTEYMVKQDFADYGVRIDKQLVAFIEVKRISQKLNERHLRQVQMYAVNEGVEWMILTNGAVWQAYHLTGGLPIVVNMAFEIDLLGPASLEEKAEKMFLLHHDALKRRKIDEVWKHRAATEPGALLGLLLSEPMLEQIRKEVKRRTGMTTTAEILSEVIKTEIVDPKVLAKHYKA
jgi:Type I restriction enzyme R protein N terminus (HSDR_N)